MENVIDFLRQRSCRVRVICLDINFIPERDDDAGYAREID